MTFIFLLSVHHFLAVCDSAVLFPFGGSQESLVHFGEAMEPVCFLSHWQQPLSTDILTSGWQKRVLDRCPSSGHPQQCTRIGRLPMAGSRATFVPYNPCGCA